MPDIEVAPGGSTMRTLAYENVAIVGTSFSAPAVLGVAIQAHQYEGWFSALAFPMVNKAILIAAARDANSDNRVGMGLTWSSNAPSQDAKDGAGQIFYPSLKTILDNNRYYYNDLADSMFASCGTNCREFVVGTVAVPAGIAVRVALAWQACVLTETGVPTLNNDLDLRLTCGNETALCGQSYTSNTVTSEMEVLERPGCSQAKTCTIRIRIKNGATLAACGSTPTERVGVAWSLNSW